MGIELPGVAFISGAGGGMGRACALEFARSGCRGMLITDNSQKTLEETARRVKEVNTELTLLVQVADISDDGTADRLIEQVVNKFGRLDYGLNVAGISGAQRPLVDLSPSDYDLVESVNARAVWLCERAQITQMLKQDRGPTHDGRPGDRGSIVNIASICGIVGFPNSTPYTMTKHAVLGLVKSDSTTFGGKGIRVNAVCPGIIETPFITPEARQFADGLVQTFTSMKRTGTAQEIADVVAFLSSSRATYVCGTSFTVDGGYTAQ